MTKVISFLSGKGGVGKSTIAINVAYRLASLGYKTYLIDSSLSTPDVAIMLGFNRVKYGLFDYLKEQASFEDIVLKKDNLYIIPSNLGLKVFEEEFHKPFGEIIINLLGQADYVIIDCAAGFGKEAITAISASDECIIVTVPELPAIIEAMRGRELVKRRGVGYKGYVLNMVGHHKYELDISKVIDVMKEEPLAVLPFDINVKKALKLREPIFKVSPNSKFAKEIDILVSKIVGKKIKRKKESFFSKIFSIFFRR